MDETADRDVEHVEGGKQGNDAVLIEVMRQGADAAVLNWQAGSGAVEPPLAGGSTYRSNMSLSLSTNFGWL
ncbi:hypothetical protein [Mesorhizobium argentiipisi]|uniref:Uncharacterized protein n=1 Tax=Mesorhizobium argentiipisi TaxID=3015175 RepID=A0ABU8K969_9HYPH